MARICLLRGNSSRNPLPRAAPIISPDPEGSFLSWNLETNDAKGRASLNARCATRSKPEMRTGWRLRPTTLPARSRTDTEAARSQPKFSTRCDRLPLRTQCTADRPATHRGWESSQGRFPQPPYVRVARQASSVCFQDGLMSVVRDHVAAHKSTPGP